MSASTYLQCNDIVEHCLPCSVVLASEPLSIFPVSIFNMVAW